ncbi:MAG: flagellar biosynthesis protein FlhB [bacterium]|nr:flagellar biosynthesis protein FlhB [bacterium]
MAEEFTEKTEEPTARRLSKAREEGNLVSSNDLAKATSMLAAWLGLLFLGKWINDTLIIGTSHVFSNLHSIQLSIDNIGPIIATGTLFMLKLIAPFGILAIAIAFATAYIQHGWNYSTKPLKPDVAKMNPLKGWSRFFKPKSLVEIGKSLLKILIVGFAIYGIVFSQFHEFQKMIDYSVPDIYRTVASSTMTLIGRVVFVFLALGIADFFITKFFYYKDLRMSKQEVQDEFKQQEGDPKIKSKLRQIQINTAYGLTVRNTKNATVLVTNPTHVAVGLQYESETMKAPKVIAKGTRLVALRMKEIAKEEGIPIVENPPLARALYRGVPVGQDIPGNFYQAVAEVLAYVYRLQEEKRNQSHNISPDE